MAERAYDFSCKLTSTKECIVLVGTQGLTEAVDIIIDESGNLKSD